MALAAGFDGGSRALGQEELLNRDSVEGLHDPAIFQRKLLHERCYEGFSRIAPRVCEIFHLQLHE